MQILTNEELIERYPFLILRAIDSDEPIGNGYGTWLDEIPSGWREAFGMQLCEDLRLALLKSGGENFLYDFRIYQIKEKYGTLRIYTNWSTLEVDSVINKYENLSAITCIYCGQPATKLTRGWVVPVCDKCVDNETEFYPL